MVGFEVGYEAQIVVFGLSNAFWAIGEQAKKQTNTYACFITNNIIYTFALYQRAYTHNSSVSAHSRTYQKQFLGQKHTHTGIEGISLVVVVAFDIICKTCIWQPILTCNADRSYIASARAVLYSETSSTDISYSYIVVYGYQCRGRTQKDLLVCVFLIARNEDFEQVWVINILR